MTIKIRFSLTAEDYREYQRMYLARIAPFWERTHFRISVTFGIIVFIAGLNWIFFVHRGKYPGFVSTVGGLYLIFAGGWGKLKWRRWFRKHKHLYQDFEAEITEESLTVRSTTKETRAKWDHYSGLVESKNLLVLRDSEGNCLVVPKGAFAPGELESFLNLLHTRLGHVARQIEGCTRAGHGEGDHPQD